jgi:hypothetical protein
MAKRQFASREDRHESRQVFNHRRGLASKRLNVAAPSKVPKASRGVDGEETVQPIITSLADDAHLVRRDHFCQSR